MNNFMDIVDKLFADLMDIKKMHRSEQIKGSWSTAANKEINKHLTKLIENESEVPER
tara:strand:+ start:685 stop:855 length:171 start_codon:yes stop_codon:yes gene_type:complete